MIKICNIKKKYKDNVIFDDMSVTLFEGNEKVIVLNGLSGSGKSTLMNMLMNLDQDYEGDIYIDDNNLDMIDKLRESTITCMFQEHIFIETLTVIENLSYISNCTDEKIIDVLNNLSIANFKDSLFRDLSGGQRQRVAIARVLLSNAKYVIMDEPSSALDDESFNLLNEQIKNIDKRVLIITHDNRFKDNGYMFYKIENKQLVLLESGSDNVIENENKIHEKINVNNFLIIVKYVKRNLGRMILNNAIFIIIFAIFMIFNTLLITEKEEFDDYLYNGIDETTIAVDLNTIPQDQRTDIYFDYRDVEYIESLEGIEETHYYNNVIMRSVTSNGAMSALVAEKQFYQENIDNRSVIYGPENIEFMFKSIPIDAEYMIAYDGGLKIDLIYGTYPDEEYEILVPDVFADIYCQENIDNCTGEFVEIPVIYSNGEESVVAFEIVGIYETNYESAIEQKYDLYISYANRKSINTYNSDMMNVPNSEFSDSEEAWKEWKENYSSDYEQMIVKVETPEDVERVSAEIEAMYPGVKLFSQYAVKNGEYSTTILALYTSYFVMYLLCMLILVFIVWISNRSNFKNKIKEYALLYSYGVESKQIYKALMYENLLMYSFYFIIAVLIVFGLSLININTELNIIIDKALKFNTLLYSYIFLIIVTIIISMLNIKQMNKKRMIKYLRNM